MGEGCWAQASSALVPGIFMFLFARWLALSTSEEMSTVWTHLLLVPGDGQRDEQEANSYTDADEGKENDGHINSLIF